MEQHLRARKMTEEQVSEAGAFRRAFDEAGDVGKDEALLRTHAHHAEVRMKRCKGIVRNLRAGIGHRRNEGGLAGIGHPEKAHISEHLEFELERAVLTGFARRELARSAVDGALEVKVPETALAAGGKKRAGAVFSEVGNRFARIRVADDRAYGHAQDDVLAARAVAVCAATVFARGSEELSRVLIVDERIDVAVSLSPHGAAAAAVAAVRAALRNELLAAEARGAVAALAALNLDSGFVDEFHNRPR